MFFSIDAPYFSVSNITYDTTVVPEPSTLIVIAAGFLGLSGLKLRRKC